MGKQEPVVEGSASDGRDRIDDTSVTSNKVAAEVSVSPADLRVGIHPAMPRLGVRKSIAVGLTLAMVMVGFQLLALPVAGAMAGGAASAVPTASKVYGEGLSVATLGYHVAQVDNLATFQRWDGVDEPLTDLNFSTGEWPYRVQQSGAAFTVTRGDWSFTQGRIPGASYSFQVDRIKETVAIPSSPGSPQTMYTISVPFSSTLTPIIRGSSIQLRQGTGGIGWYSAPFEAWDSAVPLHSWSNPVVSIVWTPGALVLTLNPTMMKSATYPLYVDPTWVLGASAGWGASTFANATTDLGDGTVKIGYFADNFNNNNATGWTTSPSGVTFNGGTLNIGANDWAFHAASWSALNAQFDALIPAKCPPTIEGIDFFFGASSVGATGTPELKISPFCQTINRHTIQGTSVALYDPHGTLVGSYTATLGGGNVRISASTSGEYQLFWNGVLVSTGSGVAPPIGGIYFQMYGATFSVDNLRIWNTDSGSVVTPVRDAGVNRPLQVQIAGTVDAYDQIHIQIRSAATSTMPGAWTDVKADVASGTPYSVPDQERLEYYQLRITVTSGTSATPILTQVSTTEGSIPLSSPSANTGSENWYPYLAGMVNLVNGNLFYTHTDISFQGKGFTLALIRSYNSALASRSGPFGLGWTFNYGQSLSIASNGNVTWTGPDGSSFLFVPKGSTGGYSPPAGVPDRLVKNSDGSFTLSMTDGSSDHFSSSGVLLSLSDKNGNSLAMTYSTGKTPLLLKVSDETGKSLTFNYSNSEITTVTDPAGRQASYVVGTTGDLVSFVDPNGDKWQYNLYSSSNELERVVDPVGEGTQVTYNGGGEATAIYLQSVNLSTNQLEWQYREYAISYNTSTARGIQNARGYWTSVTLDSSGNPIGVSGPGIGCSCDSVGNSSSLQWDGEMNEIAHADGRGDTSTMTYGFRQNPLTSMDPGGNVSSRSWLEVNNATSYLVVPLSSTTYRGFTTTFGFDSKGNRVSVTDPGGNVTHYSYDSSGFLNKTVSARGFATWFVYNASGWLVKREDNLSETMTYGYDAIGRQTSVTDPMGFSTTTTYDADNRVTKATDALGDASSYQYNARGDRTRVTDPDGATTTYAYNLTNAKVQSMTDSGGNLTRYAYDLRGNLNATTDADGHTTFYQYDAVDRVTKTTTPLGYVTKYVYDAAGNRIARTDDNGATTRYAYDRLNRIETTTYPGAPVYGSPQTLTFTYDQDGNRVSATGFGYTETFEYDRSDRMAYYKFSFGSSWYSISYTYDQDGNKASMTYSGGGTTLYSYDPVDRLSTIRDSENLHTTYGYDKDSRQTSKVDPSGVATTSLYDKASRLTAIYTNTSIGAVLESFTYAYDKAGLRTSETDIQNGVTTATSYVYDRVQRLFKSTTGSSTTTDLYDAVGNLVTETKSSTETFTYDAGNELLKSSFGTTNYVTYAYDKNGNRIKATTSGGAVTTYAYDYENRLIGVSGGCNYTYAPTGERVSSACATGTTLFGYDVNTPGGSNLLATFTSIGSQTARYLDSRGANTPLEVYEGGNHYAFQTDALGSVRMLTGGSQNATDSYGYDPWGNVVSQGGSVSNLLQFTSSLHDSSSGLDDMRARFYDPTANGGHQFLSQDPKGCPSDPTSKHAYVGDNPVTRTDPTGENIVLPTLCFGFPCIKGWNWIFPIWGSNLCVNFNQLATFLIQNGGDTYTSAVGCATAITLEWGFFAPCLQTAFWLFAAGQWVEAFGLLSVCFGAVALACGYFTLEVVSAITSIVTCT